MLELNVILVDDEPLALDLLRSMLQRQADVEISAECKNGQDAVVQIGKHNPDVVFLDIQMPGLNGFEVVKSLQADTMPLIVFATAFDEFALHAFDLHAVDYILKPLSEERLERSLQRARNRLRESSGEFGNRKTPIIGAIDDIIRRADEINVNDSKQSAQSSSDTRFSTLLIRESGTLYLVDQDEIDWVDAAGDYMCVHVGENTHIVRTTMKKLVESLDDRNFARIHRSTIVNLNRIDKVTPLTKGECMIELHQGARLKVSRNFRDSIDSWLQQ